MPKARKMLSNWNAAYIQSLMKLIETQSKATLAIWAVDYADRVILPLWSKHYPNDFRPQNALNAAREWLSGAIKLPQAKAVILECHASAREADGNAVAQAAARAIGQCAAEECGRMLDALRAVVVENEPNPAIIDWKC